MPLKMSFEQTIQADPARVWSVATDIEAMKQWMPNLVRLEKITEGDFGPGTQWRETRKMFGKEANEHFEVTTVDAPLRFDLFVDGTKGSSKKGAYVFKHTFEPAGDGTRMVLEGEITGMGRIGEFFGKLMMGPFKKAMKKDLAALKDYIESEAQSP